MSTLFLNLYRPPSRSFFSHLNVHGPPSGPPSPLNVQQALSGTKSISLRPLCGQFLLTPILKSIEEPCKRFKTQFHISKECGNFPSSYIQPLISRLLIYAQAKGMEKISPKSRVIVKQGNFTLITPVFKQQFLY